MRTARLFALFGALLVSAPAGLVAAARAATPQPSTDARPLIVAAVAAPRHVSFVGQMSSIVSGTHQAFAYVAKIEHRAPDETRRTYLAPRGVYGEYVITHGAISYDVEPLNKRVVVSENKTVVDPVAIVDDIALLDGNYRAVRSATDNVADRRTDVVDLVSRYTGERVMRLWIDSDMHVVLAKEAYHSDGSLAWRTRFDEIRYTDAIPEAIFSTSVPSGYDTVRGRSYSRQGALPGAITEAGFTPITPKYLPDGFILTGADVSRTPEGIKNLHLLYTDGIRNLSLFENASDRAVDFSDMQAHATSFEGHDAQYAHDGSDTLLSWRERRLTFLLVGDLDLTELVPIAKSVVP
ncbi:MAG TPA: sigma-E factor regulatory protein RseB domain-containing protein [Candidatus Sulfotelmatobacter sp.]|nr:sigma-E factor regulatory protein RseB domain-containing protein [Candidatus Sulfotelmatobacter sp.]